ncbi:L-piperidine-6-carboxylate dehydrogenase [Noviherbaspirillum aridicola]|uniref:aldehyde dehydrogenase (NAD(+)) n=1 Tax=Noviherbaspirillum aridicola TaxID=2849687 RepID=A0ABQ4Q9M4_9BURK|nr:aldehyde dehydrogenase family protein [Noviherbaspirillum aridicola]GIZ53863.1 aldehyde dehydrogenase [Noviherbaspirillum aridicola]
MYEPESLMKELGVDFARWHGGDLVCRSPIDGRELARLRADRGADCAAKVGRAEAAFIEWRRLPPPRRGELVRLLGGQLRRHKEALGRLVTMESGKILQEGLGEVQEMIDICDFATGLSRQLYGLTIASERPGHRMMETWHPLGPVGIISAFNFPVAVWSWNAALALVCGDSLVWKPSEKTCLSALAVQSLLEQAMREFGEAPADLSQLLLGGRECGMMLAQDTRLPLVSATGSTRMGREVAQACAARLGRSILELGGNNTAVIAPSADLELAVRAVVFAAAGTAGQRCTSLRRLFVHASVYDRVRERLIAAFRSLAVGNPLDAGTLVGPLIDEHAWTVMQDALRRAQAEGGRVHGGERVPVEGCDGGFYARPALVEMPAQGGVVQEETFAPILYLLRYQTLEQAIAWNNAVPQGLASSIFSNDLREAELFLSPAGSDCGIANVNIGPSGAEIGGAFGGEKDTGGGREAGSDAWKNYMRRATNTINYSSELPLAQGVRFSI